MALTTSLKELRLANHDFSMSLYTEFAKNETGNIFYSPFSIHMIMFMASLGAASKTFEEIIAIIHLKKTDHLLVAYRDLLEFLRSENDNLKLATGLFIDTAFNVKDSFLENSKKHLNGSLEKLNFKNDPEQQRTYLNNWVLNKTSNKIKDLFPKDSITKATSLVLANAMHFKNAWEYDFDNAEDGFFYVIPSNKIAVKMMSLEQDLQYYQDSALKFTALELPYENCAFKMIILLPDAKDGLKDLEKNFSKIKLHEVSKKMTKYHVAVKLPRFKLEQSFQLKETLSNLGCPTMFTREANFSNISEGADEGDLYVNEVMHKAYVDVNEKGTEAAAATAIMMLTSCARKQPQPLKKVQFIADHPFVIAIASNTNLVLFMGRLSNP